MVVCQSTILTTRTIVLYTHKHRRNYRGNKNMTTKKQEQIPNKDMNEWGYPSSSKWQFVGIIDGVARWKSVRVKTKKAVKE